MDALGKRGRERESERGKGTPERGNSHSQIEMC